MVLTLLWIPRTRQCRKSWQLLAPNQRLQSRLPGTCHQSCGSAFISCRSGSSSNNNWIGGSWIRSPGLMFSHFIFSNTNNFKCLDPDSFPYSYSYSDRGTESVHSNSCECRSRSWLLPNLSAFLVYQGNYLINMVPGRYRYQNYVGTCFFRQKTRVSDPDPDPDPH